MKNNCDWSVYYYENEIKKHKFCTYEQKEEMLIKFGNNIISILNCIPARKKHNKW